MFLSSFVHPSIPQPVFLNYVASIWWSIFVITSIGPAYTAVTTAEQIFGCVYALFGMAAVCLCGTVFGPIFCEFLF